MNARTLNVLSIVVSTFLFVCVGIAFGWAVGVLTFALATLVGIAQQQAQARERLDQIFAEMGLNLKGLFDSLADTCDDPDCPVHGKNPVDPPNDTVVPFRSKLH